MAHKIIFKFSNFQIFKKYGIVIGIILLLFLIIWPIFLPKNHFQQAKEKLVKNPNDFKAHLILAEEFLKNNQFNKTEGELLAAQREKFDSQVEKLWQEKRQSDPEDIRRLIAGWEKIIEEKPNYRDAYLKLTLLHYKLYEDEKAKECLQKAINLDPNYEAVREFKKIIN